MKKINDNELKKVNGGFTGWTLAAIALAGAFISGVLDGISNPRKCNS